MLFLFLGSDPDEEFPVCELTAGGGTEEHKSEPSASLNPLLHFLLHDASNIFQYQHDYTKTADCERLKPSSLIQRNLCVRKRRLEDRNSPRTKSNQHVCPVQELLTMMVIFAVKYFSLHDQNVIVLFLFYSDVEDFLGHAQEEEGEDEAAQSTSLQQNLKNRDHQTPKARFRYDVMSPLREVWVTQNDSDGPPSLDFFLAEVSL